MTRKIRTGRFYSPADGTVSTGYHVENDPSHRGFNTREEAEAWRDRLDNPDDLGPTAARATRRTN